MKTSNALRVSIITINYNSTQATLELLKSLRKATYHDLEVIVIDNGSLEDPQHEITAAWPTVVYKRSPVNLGFAGGNNLGISLSTGHYLFFINNDTEVTPDLISNLTHSLTGDLHVGMISPKILYYGTNIIQYAGYTAMHGITARNQAIGSKQIDSEKYIGLHETAYAHGAAMMTNRNVINKIGTMPEEFFLYYEELDWCASIKRGGYKIIVDRSSSIFHKESMSVGKGSPLKLFYQTRNRILFVRRNMPFINQLLFHIYFYLLVSPLKMLRYIFMGEVRNLKTYWSALQMAKRYIP